MNGPAPLTEAAAHTDDSDGGSDGRWLVWGTRTVVAAFAGLAMYAAFPPRTDWYLAVVSLAVLFGLLLVGHPRVRTGAWIGFVYGLGFFIPLLPWIGVYVGPLPWLALAVALAGYTAAFGAIATVMMRLPVPPLWFTLAWTLYEATRSAFPFGGFPWGRTAFSQPEGPLLPIASLLGALGLSGAVALSGSALMWFLLIMTAAVRARLNAARPRPDNAPRPSPRPHTVRWATVAVLLALIGPLMAIAVTPDSLDRTVSAQSTRVAAIQGNVPRLGLDFNAQRRAVLDNHVNQTLALARAVRAGEAEQPDVVLWPENASDISPLTNPDAAEAITAASVSVGAPILVGTLIANPDGRPTNTVLVWDQDRGPVGRYDKQIIQPFGEYLPWRGFFRMFSSYADMAGNFRPGSGPSSLSVPGRGGVVDIGVATCWEIAFDSAARKSVLDGAQMLYVPTNNATFGHTDMTYQQLAMSQVRAVEHGRSVAVVATSGVSAIISADGMIESESGIFEPAVLASRMVLHDDQTLATRLGAWPQRLAVALALAGLLVAVTRHTRFSLWWRTARAEGRSQHGRSSQAQQNAKESDGIGE